MPRRAAPAVTDPLPAYRLHKASGHAYVLLNHKYVYLGRHGTPESRTKYYAALAEWLAREGAKPADPNAFQVVELLDRYLAWADGYYRKNDAPTSQVHLIEAALRPVNELYGATPAADFGPLKLKAVRELMIRGGKLSRGTINSYIGEIRRMFRWGEAEELVPQGRWESLRTLPGLQRGRTPAREPAPVAPVNESIVRATMPHVLPEVRAMIELQLLTGMRPGEVVAMRTLDLDTTGAAWLYRPPAHKTEHHGRERTIALGPQAQQVVRPWLRNELEAPIFSPADGMKRWRAERTTTGRGSRKRRSAPRCTPGDRYTVATYRRAIGRGCDLAFPPPAELRPLLMPDGGRETLRAWKNRLTPEQRAELRAWRRVHRWNPHRLRHTFATEVRRSFGLEAAQVSLGHASADVTQIYAEKNQTLAQQVALRIG